MKVVETYIIYNLGKYHLIYKTDDGRYFRTSNGAFNQADTYLERIYEDDALKLISGENKVKRVEKQ